MMKQNKSRTAAYWQKRFSAVEQAGNDMSVQMVHEIEQKYERAMRQLQGKIEAWYGRFADNNGISMTEARKLLNQGELKELKWNVDQYIEYGKRNAIDGSWMKELENASAKFHISRLEALKLECRQQIEMAAGGLTDQLDTLLADVYKDSYYRSMFEVQKGTGVGFDVAKLDEKLVQKVIRKPWHIDGSDFSSSLWQNKAKLVGSVDQALTTMVLTGGKPKDAIKVIQKKMNTSEFNAKRLVLTEQAYFTSQAQQEVYKELDTEEVEIVAGLDKRTCSTCAERDGQHYPLNQMVAGVTCPPFHPLCRCTTVPYFDDDFTDGLRASRNEEGKTVYEVPENATYKDWKKSFVDGGNKSELKEIKNDDTMSLKNKISDQDNKIDELKNQFSDATDGYSYDEWFSEFSSIEEGYGDAPDGDATFTKLKNLDEEIRNAEKQRSDLLLQKESRGQLDTGFPGKIPDDKLDEYNAKGFEQIKVDTGYSEEQATKFHDALKEYFGGDYKSILDGETKTAKIIRDGLDRMPVYDGEISRGMMFTCDDVIQFSGLKPGDTLPRRGIIESWSSSKETAIAYSGISDYERSSVILECINNRTGVGVQHLSSFGSNEAEVLSSSRYEVVEILIENKYDYLTKHKEFLYFEEDLIDEELTMRRNVVCKISVKEKC